MGSSSSEKAVSWSRQSCTVRGGDLSVTLVDVIAQGIGVAELLVTRCTRVVMEADVLAHAGRALELCIAVGA